MSGTVRNRSTTNTQTLSRAGVVDMMLSLPHARFYAPTQSLDEAAGVVARLAGKRRAQLGGRPSAFAAET